MYTINTKFEWHDKKAELNTLKHGISFEMAAFAFDDPCALIIEDTKHSSQERRQWLIGDSGKKVLVVIFTKRAPRRNIRIISARLANRRERRMYEERKGI